MSTWKWNFTSSQYVKGKKIRADSVFDLLRFKKRNVNFDRHILRQKIQASEFNNKKKVKKSESAGNINYFLPEKLKEEFVLTSYFDNFNRNRNGIIRQTIQKEISVDNVNEKNGLQEETVNNNNNKVVLPSIKSIYKNTNSSNSCKNSHSNVISLKRKMINVVKQKINDNEPVVMKIKRFNHGNKTQINKATLVSPNHSTTNFFQNTQNSPGTKNINIFPNTTKNEYNLYNSKIKSISTYNLTKCKLSSFSYNSIPGTKMHTTKENQDSILILPNLQSNKNKSPYHIFGVFDGHGDSGKTLSELTSTYINDHYINNDNITFNKETITTCINEISSTIKQQPDIELQFSGTTLNVIYVDIENHYLYCANIGDSRSIAITYNYNIIQLSTDHKPDNPNESKRILTMGGEVERVNWTTTGPYRVWLKGKEYPGLSISRSIGDLIVENVGVISDPEVNVFDICGQLIKIVVIGTDGLWEFLSNEKVKEIVCMFYNRDNNTFDSKAAAIKLISESRKLWEIKNPMGIDDISIIVLFFN